MKGYVGADYVIQNNDEYWLTEGNQDSYILENIDKWILSNVNSSYNDLISIVISYHQVDRQGGRWMGPENWFCTYFYLTVLLGLILIGRILCLCISKILINGFNNLAAVYVN